MNEITPHDFSQLLHGRQTVELIDVRTPVEFREMHLVQAKNIPLDRLDPEQFKVEGVGATTNPLYVICRSGSRGRQACDRLLAAGIIAINVEGGTLACKTAGLEMVYGKKAVSLERQVRIVAGGITLVGALLAIFVHPYFAGVSAFIGAGLMFAGITDTCGMGMLLARMPWNRVSSDQDTAGCHT